MKRIFAFFFVLFAFLGTRAQATLPHFSTEQVGLWYYVQFNKGGGFIADQGMGKQLKTESLLAVANQKWQLIGTSESFVMKNQHGRYVNIADGKFIASDKGVELKLVQSGNANGKNCWEIQRIGTSNNMNQDGGAGIGKVLGEWTANDDNNPLNFIAIDNFKELPIMSTINNPVWMKLKFNEGGCYLQDMGKDQLLLTKNRGNVKSQKWQFLQHEGYFQLRSQEGNYINFKEGKFIASETAVDFKIHHREDGKWELNRKGSGSNMNQFQGAGVDRKLSEWDVNDPNNSLTFEIAPQMVGEPNYSTLTSPKWYNLQFKKGQAFLQDMGDGENMMTKGASNAENQKWQFIGDEFGFKMRSELGNYVFYDNGNFKTTSDEKKAETLEFIQSDDNKSLELRVLGENNCMNQVGGAGANRSLGKYTINDPNNPFFLKYAGIIYPEFSEGANEQWYYIQFGRERRVLAEKGVGNNILTATMAYGAKDQMWKFEGTPEKFQMINMNNGKYATIEGTGDNARLKLSDKPFDAGFKITRSENGKYPNSYEIQANGITTDKDRLNQWSDLKEGQEIGLWSHQDDNNALYFVKKEDLLPNEFSIVGANAFTPKHALTLWYNEPATATGVENPWMEYSLPIGNGQLGACIFGGVKTDEIQFNEKTLWEGGATIGNHGGYRNFGSVFVKNLGNDITYTADKSAQNYVRFLDIEEGLAGVNFENNAGEKTSYERRYLSSEPDKVIVAHYVATGKEKLHLQFSAVPGEAINASPVTYNNAGYAEFSGKMTTVSYNAQFRVIPTGTDVIMVSDENGISISNADEVLLVLCGATDFDETKENFVSGTEGLHDKVKGNLDAAADKKWTAIYNDHIANFTKWMGRVSFQLDGAKSTVTTEQLVKNYNSKLNTGNNAEALFLEQLYFAYGRYLMISSSRGVNLPSNLQGIWNNKAYAPWNSDIHSNINVQMNYWPAEPTNLSDLHLPFLNYIINCANGKVWKQAAQRSGEREGSNGQPYVNGEVKGWTLFTENNIFGGMSTWGENYCVANAWYCSHLWQHYRYTLDKKFLAKAFPVMWSAAEYWMQRMIEDRVEKDGTFVCPDEFSAEQHDNQTEDGTAHAQQLVYGLLSNVKDALDVLGKEANLTDAQIAELNKYLEKTDRGLHTEKFAAEPGWDEWGADFGVKKDDVLLKEWKYTSYAISKDKGHRHMSHLMALYPLDQIAPNSEYFTPAVNALKLRGDAATGWSMGWKVNLWARALDGNHAHLIIKNALKHSTAYGTDQDRGGIYYNLFDSHAPFQIDGNFGVCAGIAEMLLQSHTNTIQLLPALPDVWAKGAVTGLKAVGNFEVNINWENKQATLATIKSEMGEPMVVSYPGIANVKVFVDDIEVNAKIINNNTIKIPASKGQTAKIDFTAKRTQGEIEIKTKEGFGSIYVDHAFTMPEGVKGTAVKAVENGDKTIGTLVADWEYQPGEDVPANTALLLHGTQGKHYYNLVSGEVSPQHQDNLLKGSLLDELTEDVAGTKYYMLTYSMIEGNKTLGFFFGAKNGGAFMNKATHAYLAVPGAMNVKGFRLEDLINGIDEVETNEDGENVIYTLAGVRVNATVDTLPKGIYVVNGKKVIIK